MYKHTSFGPLLEVKMSKKCTPLWREAHFEVKMYKTLHVRAILEVQMSKKCTPLWREAHFEVKPLWREAHLEVKCVKNWGVRTTLGSWDVEKLHVVVARSTFRSQNVQSTPASDHFWKLRCRKSARHCGAKHISKWKCTKHYMFAPLLEVQMSKKCTPLWREAHFEVKMYKTLGCSDHFWRFRCRFAASLHYTTLHYTTLHYTTLHYTTLHSTTLQLQLHN